jgi:hypothetical protein
VTVTRGRSGREAGRVAAAGLRPQWSGESPWLNGKFQVTSSSCAIMKCVVTPLRLRRPRRSDSGRPRAAAAAAAALAAPWYRAAGHGDSG